MFLSNRKNYSKASKLLSKREKKPAHTLAEFDLKNMAQPGLLSKSYQGADTGASKALFSCQQTAKPKMQRRRLPPSTPHPRHRSSFLPRSQPRGWCLAIQRLCGRPGPYLRNFSRSSRLQEDQERSLGFLPFTHSPDMM